MKARLVDCFVNAPTSGVYCREGEEDETRAGVSYQPLSLDSDSVELLVEDADPEMLARAREAVVQALGPFWEAVAVVPRKGERGSPYVYKGHGKTPEAATLAAAERLYRRAHEDWTDRQQDVREAKDNFHRAAALLNEVRAACIRSAPEDYLPTPRWSAELPVGWGPLQLKPEATLDQGVWRSPAHCMPNDAWIVLAQIQGACEKVPQIHECCWRAFESHRIPRWYRVYPGERPPEPLAPGEVVMCWRPLR